eukprot:1180204-Prorocentrum_minimum.AAC.1
MSGAMELRVVEGGRLEGSLSSSKASGPLDGEAVMGHVFKGATKKEDLCVRLVLQPTTDAFRGWYFQKEDQSLGCLWDAALKSETRRPPAAPFCGTWDVKVTGAGNKKYIT